MKIAVIVNSFPCISEKFLLNQIINVLELNRDIDLSVYAGVPSRENKQHALFSHPVLEKRVINLNIPHKIWKRVLFLPFLFFNCLLKSPGNTFRAFSIRRYSSSALNLKNLYFLRCFYGNYFDIIHCHFGQNGLTGAFLKDCGFCSRLVVTFHGTDINAVPAKYGRNMYAYMFTRTSHITAGSNFVKKQIVDHGGKNVTVIPMGVDILSPRKSSNAAYFLSIGRLEEVKGLSYAINAFKTVSASFPGFSYMIAGNGSLFATLKNLIKQAGLENRIFLLGEKTDSELENIFENALALLVPSIRASDGSEEGQGLVIQEAEIRCIPVIGTDTGGIPEGIIQGETGWIVPEKDSTALGEKMRYFLENPEKAVQFGQAGYRLAFEKYDNKKLALHLVEKIYLIP